MSRLTVLATASIALLACTVAPEARAEDDTTKDPVVAQIDDLEITQSELEELVSDQLEQLERQRHQLLESAVGPLVEARLLDIEAKKRGISTEELIKSEIVDKAGEVSDVAVDQWYVENRSRVRGTKEELLPQIRAFLEQQGAQTKRAELLAKVRAEHDVKVFFEPMRVDLAADGATLKGPEDAAVTIVEFSDFQCPACKGFNPTLTQIQEAYGDKVRVAFRQYPLRQIHPQAQKAAEAALCARDQGKFWELHDHMFANQAKLEVADLKSAAESLGLDTEAFEKCLDSGQYADTVQADLDLGTQAGVSGTPSVYVNGRPVGLGRVPSFDQLAAVIDDEISRSSR